MKWWPHEATTPEPESRIVNSVWRTQPANGLFWRMNRLTEKWRSKDCSLYRDMHQQRPNTRLFERCPQKAFWRSPTIRWCPATSDGTTAKVSVFNKTSGGNTAIYPMFAVRNRTGHILHTGERTHDQWERRIDRSRNISGGIHHFTCKIVCLENKHRARRQPGHTLSQPTISWRKDTLNQYRSMKP